MTKTNHWAQVLTRDELEARYALTASIDARFAQSERAFYESRSAAELGALASQAWNCNEPSAYQMARSYQALQECRA